MSFSPARGPAADETLAQTSRPALGVLIPTYNRVDAVLECLRHLERQTEQDFEVVVVDDGSTDATAAELARYQAHTPLRLRCLSQPNSGPATARNLGLRVMEAPLCILIGDDIFPEPGFLAAHLDFHRHPPPPPSASPAGAPAARC